MADALLREAAERVIVAADACRDAINGLGHPGEKHDRYIHFGPSPGGIEIFDQVGDCAACGGAQYGTEDTLSEAYGDLRAALGQERKPWEVR